MAIEITEKDGRMTYEDAGPDNRNYVESFVRGLDVIRAFTRSRPRMTLSEVADHSGLNRAAARRFLLTLVREGYADTDGRFFSLRPKILELGFSAIASMNLSEIVQPILNALAERLQESCFCVVLDGDSCVYVATAKSKRVTNISIDLGSRAPAYCMSSGRVLLSGLGQEELDKVLDSIKPVSLTENTLTAKSKIRSAISEAKNIGYCLVDQEYEVGLRSISVPVLDRTGSIVAALNVCCPSPRYTVVEMTHKVLPLLLESAGAITASLPR